MTVSVVHATQHAAITTITNPQTLDVSAWSTPQPGDLVVLLYRSYNSRVITSVSGLGASWSAGYAPTAAGKLWIGTGATAAGTITITSNNTGQILAAAYLVRGLATFAITGAFANTTTAVEFGPGPVSAGVGQIVFSWFHAQDATLGAVTYPVTETPSGLWTYTTALHNGVAAGRSAYCIPTGAASSHRVTSSGTFGDSKTNYLAVIGDLVTTVRRGWGVALN